MLTLTALCTELAAANCCLSRRAARDWWTKGLLPRPQRQGLGRGRGTKTFWPDRRVIEQAQAAHDLLAVYPRVDAALLGLWLLGFPVGLRSVRAIFGKLISHDLRLIHGQTGKPPDDVVGKLAEMLARQQAREKGASVDAREALTDLLIQFLEIFFGVRSELANEGLAALWQKVAPYLDRTGTQAGSLADLQIRDEHIAAWSHHLRDMASLTAQRKIIRSASDYEFIRARRLMLLVFGYLDRLRRARPIGDEEDFYELGRRLMIVLGRLAVPILIAVLRKDALRHKLMSSVLGFLLILPRRDEWAARAAQLPT